MRLIDIDDDRNCYIGSDGEYERYNIDPDVLAEAQPERKKGRWEYKEYAITKTDSIGLYVCSECGKGNINNEDNFCPKCGADMRGDE